MKLTKSFALILITIVYIGGGRAIGQNVKRISFAKGKSSTAVKGMTGGYGVTYVLRVRSGQKLVLELTPASSLGIKVDTKGRFGEMVLLREEGGGRYEVAIEETGDHTIFVGALGRNPVSFILTVKINKLADI